MLRRVLIASGSGAWEPGALSPQIWLDDATSLTDVGGAASAWANKGSAGGSFTQSNAARRPAIIAGGLNGRRTLRFDGSDDYLSSTDSAVRSIFSNASGAWVFAVVKRAATSPKICSVVDVRTAGGTVSRLACYSGADVAGFENSGTLVARRLDADSAGVLRSPAVATAAWTMLYFGMDWSLGNGLIVTNGGSAVSATLTSSGTTAATLPGTIYIGSAATSSYSDNEVAMLMCGTGALLSTGDVDRLCDWASSRYGL